MKRLYCGFVVVIGTAILVAIAVHAQSGGIRPQVPISYAEWLRLKDDPEALRRLGSTLPDVQETGPLPGPPTRAPLGALPSPFSPEDAPAGSWTNLANTPPGGPFALSNPLLMTDGTVLVHRTDTQQWYKLTPTSSGSYVNGTWSAIASMPTINQTAYVPKFFASGVLPDGRVIIEGGEYNNGNAVWTTLGAIYNPVTDAWAAITPPAGWTRIGDASGIVLPGGVFMLSSCCDVPFHAALLDAGALTWTATGSGKADRYDEEGWSLLPDDTVLTVDAYTTSINGISCGTNTERYTPGTGAWTGAGNTPSVLADCSNANAEGGSPSYEIGPNQTMFDGRAIAFGGNTANIAHTAIFNTASSTWSAGPDLPQSCGLNGTSPCTMADAPSTMLPNGNILLVASAGKFRAPANFFELNPSNSTYTAVPGTSDAGSITSFYVNFLVLPTGQILAVETYTNTIQIYTPSGTYQSSWQPVITQAPSCVVPANSYALNGTQLNGLSEGAMYGDDEQSSTNYPMVRIVNNVTGDVFYARTSNYSSRSIAPNAASSTSFQVAAGTETGTSTLYVVANGIPSAGITVTVDPTCASNLPPTADSVSPASGSGPSQTFTYKFSDPNGFSNIDAGLVLINSSFSTTNACFVALAPRTGKFWLVNDTGDAAFGPGTVGTPSFLENSQCIVDAANSSMSKLGSTVTLNLALIFKGGFTGAKTQFMQAVDHASLSSGWISNGTWTPTNQAPALVSVTPSSGSGSSQTFSYAFSDANGASDITWTGMLLNTTPTAANSCFLAFVRATNQFYLVNDAGNATLGPVTAGTNTTLQNSHCTLDASGSSSVSNGTTLTVNAALSFTSFAGTKNNYLEVTDSANQAVGLSVMGTFVVQ